MENTTTRDGDTLPSLARRLEEMGAGLISLGRDASADEATLRASVNAAAGELRELGRVGTSGPSLRQLDSLGGDLLADYAQRQAASRAHGGVVGVRTGLNHLDETLNGLEPGKLYMLAAMPGAGKTTLALQWAAMVAQAGARALYVSLENDAIDLARKTACRLGHVSYADALKGKLTDEAWRAAIERLQLLEGRLFISNPRATMPDLSMLVEAIMERSGYAPAVIVIDYLQAWVKRMATGAETSDVRERMDRFTPALRALGEEYGCAVVAISSQNRANYKDGGMAAMKESGDIEYNADATMTLARATDKDFTVPIGHAATPLLLKVEKNRQGLTGGEGSKLLLYGDQCRIEELPQ